MTDGDTKLMEVVCKNLKWLRLIKGISQNDAAKLAGLTRTTLAAAESPTGGTSKTLPTLKTINKLASVLGVTASDILDPSMRPRFVADMQGGALIMGKDAAAAHIKVRHPVRLERDADGERWTAYALGDGARWKCASVARISVVRYVAMGLIDDVDVVIDNGADE